MSNRLEKRTAATASATKAALCRGSFPVTAGVHGHAQAAVVVVTPRNRTDVPCAEPGAKE